MELTSQPWYVTADQLDASNRQCTCCGRDLSGHAIRMLECDQRYWDKKADAPVYHDFGGVPTEKSQGAFPFGLKCAKKKLATARAVLAN